MRRPGSGTPPPENAWPRWPGTPGRWRPWRSRRPGALLATASGDATARVWDAATGAHLVTLIPLPSGGYITLLPDARYKLDGDPGDCLWWEAGLRRLGPAEVSSRFREVRRLAPNGPILSREVPRRRACPGSGSAR
jgi:hypothetical protein